ncbi:MAG: AhpC/TSA family protein [Bacteroidia bacterium]|nr:redoxin domain-containing protein [Bacteroidia bacterium]MDW8332874.1 AhpC/TSA family protein [Bacteroidia bacterium]
MLGARALWREKNTPSAADENMKSASFSGKFKAVGTAVVLTLAAGAAIYIFWAQDVKDRLPTPIPTDYKFVPVGSRVELESLLPPSEMPTLIHFYNPKCPCSRFNIDHLNELKTKFAGKIRFFAVLQTSDTVGAQKKFARKCADVPTYVDYTGAVADSFGVYSTPQAVLLDGEGKIYFRGNYNTSRYCNARETQFVRIAIEHLLAQKPLPKFPPVATTPYGCELPTNQTERRYLAPAI